MSATPQQLNFTRACFAIAKMYADILVLNRTDVRDLFSIEQLKKPITGLIFLARKFEDDGLSEGMRIIWADVIANELIDRAVKEYNARYHIDTSKIKLPDAIQNSQNPRPGTL